VDVDHCADIASLEFFAWQVLCQNYTIMFLDVLHSSKGYAVISRGAIPPPQSRRLTHFRQDLAEE
jgi:hypothetical protein